jgi:hypothetical protein
MNATALPPDVPPANEQIPATTVFRFSYDTIPQWIRAHDPTSAVAPRGGKSAKSAWRERPVRRTNNRIPSTDSSDSPSEPEIPVPRRDNQENVEQVDVAAVDR